MKGEGSKGGRGAVKVEKGTLLFLSHGYVELLRLGRD